MTHNGSGPEYGSSNVNVCVKDFYIDANLVTQEEYKSKTGVNPSFCHTGFFWKRMDCPKCPVENITYEEAMNYCRALGKRLPSDYEWDFAAKGGLQSKGYLFPGTNDPYQAGYFDHSRKTYPIGRHLPNELGIYDLAGNVRQWVTIDRRNCTQGLKYCKYNLSRSSPKSEIPDTLFWYKRMYLEPDWAGQDIGFRCASDSAITE